MVKVGLMSLIYHVFKISEDLKMRVWLGQGCGRMAGEEMSDGKHRGGGRTFGLC